MKKRLLALALVVVMAMGLAGQALAYTTPDFSDVPQTHWAYEAVMRMADQGIIQGTGNGMFSPEEHLTAEMFLTLVGRIMLPEVEVKDGDWSGPYVAELRARGLLDGTNITDETLKSEISRYDMAVILAGCVETLGSGGWPAWANGPLSDPGNHEKIPLEYVRAVALVWAAGLIHGDQNQRFNGANSMTRQEAAVVTDRLSLLKRRLAGDFPTALTVNGHDLSVADMDYYYHQAVNTAYAQEQELVTLYQIAGIWSYTPSFDPSASLKTQYVDETKAQSYHDYFLDQAKANAAQVLSLSDAAKAEGYTMSQEAQDALEKAYTDLDTQVSMYHFNSRADYLKVLYGLGMTEAIYFKNIELQALASDYYTAITDAIGNYSDEELTAYYNEHIGELNSYDYDWVYFDGTTIGEADAAALAEAKKQAEDMVIAVKATDRTSAAFSAAAEAQGDSAYVRTALLGSMCRDAPYAQWLMDPSRRDGDIELFDWGGLGYCVVQFHRAYLNQEPPVDFRHILLFSDMEDGSEPTSEHITQVKARAQALLDEFKAGERTSEAFGALADSYSQDGRDRDGELYNTGGLYESVKRGDMDMVEPVEDWCFDANRQAGDTGLIQTKYGWHVMYFQGRHRPVWMDQAEEEKKALDQEAFLEKIQTGYEAVEGLGWHWVGWNANEIGG